MSYIGNTPGVSSQRVVLEEVVSGSPKSAFVPQSGYIIGYVDVLVNGLEIDSTDFSAPDGVTVTLATAAAVGDTVKVKTWLPRGLSDGYLKSEADARFLKLDGSNVFTGNLGLGVTPVAGGGKLQLGATEIIGFQGASGGNIASNLYYSGGWKYVAAGTASLYSQSNGAHYWYGLTSGAANAAASPITTLALDSIGNISPGGNLVLANGKGIDFSAHSNAAGMSSELLDDYEVGTWTPTFTGSTTSPTCVYAGRGGTYVKIGRMVACSIRISISSASGGAGILNITGLPFTVDSSNVNCWSGIVGWNSQGSFANGHHMTSIEAASGNTYLYCHYYSTNGATFDVGAADVQAGVAVEASIVYMTT